MDTLLHLPVNSPVNSPVNTAVSSVTARVAARLAAHTVAVDPNSKLPGTTQLNNLVGGLMTWVLLACVAAVLIGAAAWGFGSKMSHYAATQNGRTMVLGGVAGAMITGAATALVNYGFGIGATVH
jgi:hypothetical protein